MMVIHKKNSILHIDVFQNIMKDLRKLPETSDYITAYGCGSDPDRFEEVDVLGDFAEAIWDEDLKNLEDEIVNAFYQLYSMDFQNSHEGIDTFYENFYEANRKEDVLRASNWFLKNGMPAIGEIMQSGYEDDDNKRIVAKWIDDHTAEIYLAYRKLMFDFELKYL